MSPVSASNSMSPSWTDGSPRSLMTANAPVASLMVMNRPVLVMPWMPLAVGTLVMPSRLAAVGRGLLVAPVVMLMS
jgi:hypothetical protein